MDIRVLIQYQKQKNKKTHILKWNSNLNKNQKLLKLLKNKKKNTQLYNVVTKIHYEIAPFILQG